MSIGHGVHQPTAEIIRLPLDTEIAELPGFNPFSPDYILEVVDYEAVDSREEGSFWYSLGFTVVKDVVLSVQISAFGEAQPEVARHQAIDGMEYAALVTPRAYYTHVGAVAVAVNGDASAWSADIGEVRLAERVDIHISDISESGPETGLGDDPPVVVAGRGNDEVSFARVARSEIEARAIMESVAQLCLVTELDREVLGEILEERLGEVGEPFLPA